MNNNLTIKKELNSDITTFKFINDQVPFIELKNNGDIYIKGKFIENDKEVVDAMRELLNNTNYLKNKTEIYFKDFKHRRDYLSVDEKCAISAHGEIFKIGDVVKHDSEDIKETAIITGFSLNKETNDVVASTTRGTARICFIYK